MLTTRPPGNSHQNFFFTYSKKKLAILISKITFRELAPQEALVAQWYHAPPGMAPAYTGDVGSMRLPIQAMWVQSLGWKIPWRKKWQPTPVFLPGESHEQRSLAGYRP